MRLKEVYHDGASGGHSKLFLGGGLYEVEDPGPSASITHYYSIAGQLVAMRDSSGTRFLLTDHLGSVAAVTDETGVLVAESERRYSPFGGELLEANSPTDFSYTGQRSLAAVGLMDYKARWYSPSLGRFTQPDNLVPLLFNPQNLNRYAYTLNNPINMIDWDGHVPMIDGLFTVTAAVTNPTLTTNVVNYANTEPTSLNPTPSDIDEYEGARGDDEIDERLKQNRDNNNDNSSSIGNPDLPSDIDDYFWPFACEPSFDDHCIPDLAWDALDYIYGGLDGLWRAASDCIIYLINCNNTSINMNQLEGIMDLVLLPIQCRKQIIPLE